MPGVCLPARLRVSQGIDTIVQAAMIVSTVDKPPLRFYAKPMFHLFGVRIHWTFSPHSTGGQKSRGECCQPNFGTTRHDDRKKRQKKKQKHVSTYEESISTLTPMIPVRTRSRARAAVRA